MREFYYQVINIDSENRYGIIKRMSIERKKNDMRRVTFLRWSLVSKGVITASALIGFLMQMTLHGWHGIRYYTNQSNLLVGVFFAYLLVKYRKKGHWNQMDMRLKGGVTVAILLTGLVYHFMLAPLKTAQEFWTIENFLSHYIVPFGALLDCIIFDKGKCYRWYDPFIWTILPLLYAIVSVAIALTTRIPIGNNPDGPFPYFFLNVDKYGFFGVLQYSLGLAVAFLIGSYLLWIFKNGFKTKERL